MIALSLLALAAAVAPPDLLEQARSAFSHEEYERAEALALEAATPPQAGAALYLAGLARFRSGRPAEALEALDQAARSADVPAPAELHYNRGACLYELGRNREAEAEYVAAAALDRKLAAVALVNAGFAALDGGAPERARALAERARALASGESMDLVVELDGHLSSAGGRTAQAESPQGPRTEGTSWDARLRLEGGWDSDALQTGLVSPNEFPGTATQATPSAVSSTSLRLSARFPLLDDLHGEVAYGFGQLAYLAPVAADRSVQQHALVLAFEHSPHDRLWLGTALEGHLAFTGLSGFRALQAGVGARGWVALDESRRTTTRLDAGYTRKTGLAREFDYLGGDRLEAAISQEVRLAPVTLGAGYRFLLERIGTSRQQAAVALPGELCPQGCTQQFVEPFGYAGNAVWVSARVAIAPWLELELSGGREWRDYLADNFIALTQPDGTTAETGRARRHDQRWFTGAGVTFRLSRRFAFLLRHELVVNRSNLGNGTFEALGGGCGPSGRSVCNELGSENRSYDKHVFMMGTSLAW